jgi:predicted MPP superfamily phosphohydrolase
VNDRPPLSPEVPAPPPPDLASHRDRASRPARGGSRRLGRRGGRGTSLRVGAYYLLCWSIIAALVPRAPRVLWPLIVVAIASTALPVAFVVRGGWQDYPTAAFRLFVVRPVLYIQLLLPLVAGAGLVGMVLGAPFGVAIHAGRLSGGGAFVALFILLSAGYVGSAWLVVRHVDAVLPELPAAWEGMRIAQISDLHVGPHTSRRFLTRVGETIETLGPDLIAITGDMVDDRAEDVADFAAAVGALHAPLGVYIIPGNHDIYAGWPEVERRLRTLLPDATVLVNDARILMRDGVGLAVAGTGDPAGRGRGDDVAPDVGRMLRAVPPDTFTIALAHNPALWPALAERGVALTLSGHTHWGQLALPRWGWSLASPFLERAMGAHVEGEALLYINPGTGYWGLPFRIGAHPEVTLVTLHRGRPASIRPGRATTAAADG